MTKEQHDEFAKAAEPLMKYLAENHNPHSTVIVTSGDAQLMTGEATHATDKFIPD